MRDPFILNALATLPREAFVPESQKALAYMDEPVVAVPATEGSRPRYLLPPMVLARLLQSAAIAQSDHVLDIGGATGYSAAVLAQICRKVEALETSEIAGRNNEADLGGREYRKRFSSSWPAQSARLEIQNPTTSFFLTEA